MASRKPNRRGRDASGHIDPYYQRRIRYQAVLGALGLAEAFGRMPREIQELFWKSKFPAWVPTFDESFPQDKALRQRFENNLRAAAVRVNGMPIPSRDVLTVLTGCEKLILSIDPEDIPKAAKPVQEFLRDAAPAVAKCVKEHLTPAFKTMFDALWLTVNAHSRLEGRVLNAQFDTVIDSRGKLAQHIRLSACKPEVRHVRLDGNSRPALRVAARCINEETKWLSWTPAQLGWDSARDDGQAEYPVYIQSHALRQLRERVNLPPATPFLELWLSESLSEPRIVGDCGGGDLLVEYQIRGSRIGYLIVTPLKEERLIVVRTFKFLTMENTPEAKLLKKRLRLKRPDVEWLGLDDLRAFTQTDLKNDPVLRPMLEECGCGHLFALAESDAHAFAPQPKPLAEEMKRYLRMAA